MQSVVDQWVGAEVAIVDLDDGGSVRALNYPQLTGPVATGAHVLMNSSALDRGLGTGGFAFIVANLESDAPPAPTSGHLVKARYTPMQSMVLSVDEQGSEHHAALRDADTVAGLPVVVADLHSSVPAILAGIRARFTAIHGRAPRVVYIMTDGGALPAWFSRTISGLRLAGWLQASITCGQAFGGDYESVTLHTALLAARIVVEADVAVVAQGPGNLGTDTRWGFSGVSAGDALNAVAALRGRGVGVLRMSQADSRWRHLGVSHHSVTAYGRVALAAADLVLPPEPRPRPAWWAECVSERVAEILAGCAGHRLHLRSDGDLVEILRSVPVPLSTMGRGLVEDELAFTAAAAAGCHAAELTA
ncbi:DUF3866 family protein [Rarobacter faecitabidus]|uniref:DUF3866 family protein n=1 Tax=Rarobacter faecitabidus TaxID=13243 RepID=UPI001FE8A341|nr:DUF3866 family protein [Rarobacter faecitabidus]